MSFTRTVSIRSRPALLIVFVLGLVVPRQGRTPIGFRFYVQSFDLQSVTFQSRPQFRQVFAKRLAGGFGFRNDACFDFLVLDLHFYTHGSKLSGCKPQSDDTAFGAQVLKRSADTLDQLDPCQHVGTGCRFTGTLALF